MNSIDHILLSYTKKKGIVQPKALGAEEVTLFMLRAPETQQDIFMNLLADERVEEAIGMVENFLQIDSGALWNAMHT